MPKTAADLDPDTIFASIDFGGARAIVAAVSGGGDSLALLFLLKEYLAQRGADAPQLTAVTIDHGLRPESADEAEAVARLCREHGIEHRTLRWEGEKPKTGLPAAAREARYRLLVEAARKAGARIIVTGHTRDDQIETFLMRGARGVGRGLAGMAGFTLLDGQLWLVRPLLNTRREDLRSVLRKRNIEWFDDPTNENLAFERPRVRARLGDGGSPSPLPSPRRRGEGDLRVAGSSSLPAPGMNKNAQTSMPPSPRLRGEGKGEGHSTELATELDRIAKAVATRRAQGEAVADFLGVGVRIEPAEDVSIDANALKEARHDVATLALGVLASVIGGRSFLPGDAERERLFTHLSGQAAARLGLGGCIIKRGRHRHHIWREARGLPELLLSSGESSIWDGRYRIANGLSGGKQVRIAPLVSMEFDDFCLNAGIDRTNIRRAAALTGPAVYVDGKLMDIPAVTGGRFLPAGLAMTRHIALFDKILPGHDLALANAVRRLFGFANYPDPPIVT
ncbi:tRNA(Ile)-lysidine synthase [Phyllobacterium leguminum]|uniref:tRNA(Ile)-lysidine synthase n=1 Tax=Phyllobacterium leguminum TaxID=314237 RepID=A0A318TC90_9HYPH|nr:tRNA(Ile)-lysidine synthase [Phyllobacterium leguminum]